MGTVLQALQWRHTWNGHMYSLDDRVMTSETQWKKGIELVASVSTGRKMRGRGIEYSLARPQ